MVAAFSADLASAFAADSAFFLAAGLAAAFAAGFSAFAGFSAVTASAFLRVATRLRAGFSAAVVFSTSSSTIGRK